MRPAAAHVEWPAGGPGQRGRHHGATTAVAVRTGDWAQAFAALNAAGAPVMLAGRAIRVANANPGELQDVLKAAGIQAILQPVPATIEERMLVLAREAGSS